MFCISNQRSYEGKGFIQLLRAFYNSIVLFWSVCLFINCFLMISILLPRRASTFSMEDLILTMSGIYTNQPQTKCFPTQALRVCRFCYLLPQSVAFSLIERLFLIRW